MKELSLLQTINFKPLSRKKRIFQALKRKLAGLEIDEKLFLLKNKFSPQVLFQENLTKISIPCKINKKKILKKCIFKIFNSLSILEQPLVTREYKKNSSKLNKKNHSYKKIQSNVLNEKLIQKKKKKILRKKEKLVIMLEKKNFKPKKKLYFFITIERKPNIIFQREKLPILMKEQQIMEIFNNNEIIIICGETGCGKTTQIPQFLYEAGYGHKKSGHGGLIGITQPRRVATVNVSERVGKELNLPDEVSYQIRYDSRINVKTRIKFMTDGILLREIQDDFLLRKYSVIILDEAHERNLNTDILIGLLSRIVTFRNSTDIDIDELKLIIMSATLRIEELKNNKKLFPVPPPVISIPVRQHPVTIHFNKNTPTIDWLDATFYKICRIHLKLPLGHILTFLTGQKEIKKLVKQLRERFRYPNINCFINKVSRKEYGPIIALPLYALLGSRKQKKVFQHISSGIRLIICSTNVAETSVTIPNIRYVLDCGRVKQKIFDPIRDLTKVEVTWISQASALQRSGRAGRTNPGHTYRLYSSSSFVNYFPEHMKPQILREPISNVLLLMKNMNIQNVLEFPFPTTPSLEALKSGEKTLKFLNAITLEGKITTLGQQLIHFPVGARFAKMLLLSNQGNCMGYIIAIVAGLSIKYLKVFHQDILHNGDSEKKKKIEFQFIKNPNSDFFGILKLIGAYYCSKNKNFISQEFYRNKKQLEEVIKLMKQLERIILNCYNNINLNLVSILSKIPTNKQQILLSQIILSGFIDHVARLWPKNKQISYNLFSVGSYQCLSCLDPVFIHPKSYFFSIEQPPWLVYQQLKKNKKTYMKGCTRIEPHWLFNLAKELCTISTPLDNPSPKYELYSDRIICFVEVKFSASGWSLPIQKIELIDNVLNLRYFAKFFIEGRVFFDFKQFSPYLILDSDLLINHNTQQKEVIDLLDELKQKNCNSKKRLKKIWINDRKFLLKIILMWIHPSKHKRLKYMWPLNS